jgi:hypothetical protein
MMARPLELLLNLIHALDHLFLLTFATAVAAIAADFGFARWEDLIPCGVGAFALFGLGSLPAGRLGDLWGRRRMMLVFFFGIGAASILVAQTQNPWQMAATLTLLGAFASTYHPVGIPMLVRQAKNPGRRSASTASRATSASRRRRCSPATWSRPSAGARPSSCPGSCASRSAWSSCAWRRPSASRRRSGRASRACNCRRRCWRACSS